MSEIGYKLLDDMRSIVIEEDEGGVLYKINEWVEPHDKCGPLCLFKSLKDAKENQRFHNKIYQCEYEPSKEKIVWIDEKYLEYNDEGNDECVLECLYKNTILAKRIKILEEVKA